MNTLILAPGLLAFGFAAGMAAHRHLVRRALTDRGIAAAWRAEVLNQALAVVRSSETDEHAIARLRDIIPPEHR